MKKDYEMLKTGVESWSLETGSDTRQADRKKKSGGTTKNVEFLF